MAVTEEIDDCCKPVTQKSPGKCPICGNHGKSVSVFTISVFLKDPEMYLQPEKLPQGNYLMCETKSCPVVYFNSNDSLAFKKHELRVKVWQKEDDPEVPACYCFNNSVSSLRGELTRNGTTDVIARISAEVKAGNCRCEVTNPQGSCCLGNVIKAVKIAKEGIIQVPQAYR